METTTLTYHQSTRTTLKFCHVTNEDVGLLRHFFERYPSRSCDFTVGGVLLWNNFYKYSYAVVDDTLLLMGVWPGSDLHIFYAPCGPMDLRTFKRLISNFCDNESLKGIIMLPEEYEPSEEGDGRPIDDMLMADWMEYLYDIEKFKKFPGKKMSKKRNHLNFFMSHYSDKEFVEIDGSIADELIQFTEKFRDNHSKDATSVYEANEIIEALKHYEQYPYFGIAIRVNGKIAAYTFGECIGDTMIIHAEKADIEFGGIYQAIASEFALAVSEKYPEVRYLNREDDMGSEDLRKSKLSYHPALFVAKRVISL